MDNLAIKIRDTGIVPVVKLDNAAHAVPLAKALEAGGIPAAEITFRTAAAEESIKAVSREVPGVLVGAGTVTSVQMAKTALNAGAAFIVTPGFDPAIVDFCLENKVPIFPGVSTPTEIQAGISKGLTILKFFPAEQAGGVAMLNAFSGPFANIQFMPTGGISAENIGTYARLKNVIACGGSWMIKSDLIEAGNWAEITALCKTAVQALHGFSFAHVGFNAKDETEAEKIAALVEVFGFPQKASTKSIFNGTEFETMKIKYFGTHGHIGLKTWSVERALAYLSRQGFKANMDTATYLGEEGKSPMKFVYLDKEIGGFAFHLMRA